MVTASDLQAKIIYLINEIADVNHLGIERMYGAWLGSLSISIKKAKTSRFFDINTGLIPN